MHKLTATIDFVRPNLGHCAMVLSLASLLCASAVQAQTPALDGLAKRVSIAVQENLAGCTVFVAPYRATSKTAIYPRTGRTVTLGFQNDETISQTIWDETNRGDLVEEFVHPDVRTLTVRLKGLLPVTGVVTTTQRRYFLLVAPNTEGMCHQGVVFSGSDTGTGFNPFGSSASQSTGTAAASVSEVSPQARPSDDVFTGQPNFNYTITGETNFKPIAVYDNGKFTWIQMGPGAQVLPAVFYSGPNGLEIVNYTTVNNGSTIIVNRLMEKVVLKIGVAEVTVTAGQQKR